MRAKDIDFRVREVLAIALKTEVPLTGPFSRGDEPKWDSLKNVEIIIVLEDEFAVKFEEEDFSKLDSVANIVALLEDRIAT